MAHDNKMVNVAHKDIWEKLCVNEQFSYLRKMILVRWQICDCWVHCSRVSRLLVLGGSPAPTAGAVPTLVVAPLWHTASHTLHVFTTLTFIFLFMPLLCWNHKLLLGQHLFQRDFAPTPQTPLRPTPLSQRETLRQHHKLLSSCSPLKP